MKPESLDAFYRLTMLDPQKERVEDLTSGQTDWEEVVSIAYKLFSPLILYRNIKRLGLDRRLRLETFSRLKADYLNITRKNLSYLKDFFDVARLFNENDIAIMPLKGISMIIDTYPDEGVRPIFDLDIFVNGNDVEKSLTLLKEAGYAVDIKSILHNITRPNQSQAYAVTGPDKPFIDLHYRFFKWYEERHVYKIDSSKFFEGSFTKTVNKVKLNFLRKEDEFYYSLISIFNTGYKDFKYYLDAGSLIKIHGDRFNWDRVVSSICSSGIRPYLVEIFDFLVQRLKAPVPDKVIKSITNCKRCPSHVNGMTIEKKLFAGQLTKHQKYFYTLFGIRNIFDKVNLIKAYIEWQCFKRFGLFRNFFSAHDSAK